MRTAFCDIIFKGNVRENGAAWQAKFLSVHLSIAHASFAA